MPTFSQDQFLLSYANNFEFELHFDLDAKLVLYIASTVLFLLY